MSSPCGPTCHDTASEGAASAGWNRVGGSSGRGRPTSTIRAEPVGTGPGADPRTRHEKRSDLHERACRGRLPLTRTVIVPILEVGPHTGNGGDEDRGTKAQRVQKDRFRSDPAGHG